MSRRSFYGAVTILAGASLSDLIDLAGLIMVGLDVPTIDSAALTFQVCATRTGTYRDLYDDAGNEVTIPASTGARSFTAPAELVGWAFVKVRSGTTGAPVNQTLETAIIVQAFDS